MTDANAADVKVHIVDGASALITTLLDLLTVSTAQFNAQQRIKHQVASVCTLLANGYTCMACSVEHNVLCAHFFHSLAALLNYCIKLANTSALDACCFNTKHTCTNSL